MPKPFDSMKELYIAALDAAIKYNDSFFDAHWDGFSTGEMRDKQLLNPWVMKHINFGKKKTMLLKKDISN